MADKKTQELIASSTQTAQEAAKLIGGSFTQGGGFKPGSTTATNTSGGGTTSMDKFLQTLQSRILNDGGIISSEDSATDKFAEAISEVRRAGDASRQRLESQSNREIGFQREQFQQQRDSALSGVGAGFNQAALQQLDERTEKSLRDLEQRKQELILAGDAQTAQQVAQLQVQAEQFRLQSQQQLFTNMFQLAGIQLQKNAQDQAAQQFRDNLSFRRKEFELQQDTQIASIATQFGLDVEPGETMASIVNKARPFAKKEAQARLDKLLEDSNKTFAGISVKSDLEEAIIAGQSPLTAAQVAFNAMEELGFKGTTEDLHRFVEEAERIKKDLELQAAVEESKSISFFESHERDLKDPQFVVNLRERIKNSNQKVNKLVNDAAEEFFNPNNNDSTTAFNVLFNDLD